MTHRLRSILSSSLSFGVPTVLALAALSLLVAEPAGWLAAVAALALTVAAASMVVRWSTSPRSRNLLRLLQVAMLGLAVSSAVRLAWLPPEGDPRWQQSTQQHLDRSERQALAALIALEGEAYARAEAALGRAVNLDDLASPVRLSNSDLSVGVAVWEGGQLLAWAGEVPGPDRPPLRPFPLIVDHGFRRYMTVSVESDPADDSQPNRVATVDVSLGITRALFPRMGVGEAPGAPLSRLTGVDVQLMTEPPRGSLRDAEFDRLVAVPEDEPWVWLALNAPAPRDQRRAAIVEHARAVAVSLLLSLLGGCVLAWRRWPAPGAKVARRLAAVWAVLLVLGFRFVLDRAGVLDLAFGNLTGNLQLLVEPAYFATTRGFGLLRSVLDFLLTAAAAFAVAVLLLPAWVQAAGHRRSRWLVLVVLVAGTAFSAVCYTTLQEIAVENANPKLVGLEAPFFTVPFLCLHLAMLLAMLAPVCWVLLGWEYWLRGMGRAGALAVTVVSFGLWWWGMQRGLTAGAAAWGAAQPMLAWALVPAVRDPSFARRVVAGLVVILWLAGLQSAGLEQVYAGVRQRVALDDANEQLAREVNWRRFLLEEVLGEVAKDQSTVEQLANPVLDRSNAAFEIWAGSSLSALGDGSRVQLLGGDGRVLSEFELGLGYEPRPLLAWWRANARSTQEVMVVPVELATEHGPVLVYRGVLNLLLLVPGGDAAAVLVDLPFPSRGPAPSMDLVTAGPAALGFAVTSPLSPRREFDEPVMLGQLGEEFVVAADDPVLLQLGRDQLPPPEQWRSISLGDRRYRVSWQTDNAGSGVVVAFAEPTMADRVLDASRLTALYVASGLLVVLLALPLRAVRDRPKYLWPRFLGEFGFQERLLAAIGLVVLLPLLISGVFHDHRAQERLKRENLDEVRQRLDTALNLLASSLDDMAAALISGEYVQEVLASGNTTARRDLGPFEESQVMIFAESGDLLLDESLRNLSPQEARDMLDSVVDGELIMESNGREWFMGRVYPVTSPAGQPAYVFVRRQLTDKDLGRIARTVGTDLTLYDGPWAVVSSQDYLLKSGLVSPVLPARAQRVVREGGSRLYVESDQGRGLNVAKGFAVVPGALDARRGVLSARLFARATEAAREQRRAQLFLFGLSSLAFMLAVGVGLLVAARIVDPIRTLVHATQRVGAGDLDVRLPAHGEDEIGQLVRSFNKMTDDLRGSQAKLAARRGFLEAILGSLSAGVLVIVESGAVQEANAAAKRLLEGRMDEMLTRIENLARPDRLVATEIKLPAGDGPRTLRVVIDPIALEDGQSGWLVLFDDVTELLASRRLALYAEMARQVAHEVKNPLTPIQLAAQMVRQACVDDHPRMQEIVDENVSQIERQVARLRNIASEFSLLGRSDLPDLTTMSLSSILEDIRAQYPSADGSILVETRQDGDHTVHVSSGGIVKVLTNLVENALQAMGGQGHVVLSAARIGDQIEVRVEDEGPGIPAEVEDRLFEPYFSTKSTGTGLGLVICRNLMEKMGGSIRLENRTEGQGAVAIVGLSEA